MVVLQLSLLSLIAATAISATEIPYKFFSNVTIVALGKTKNETGGEGHVAAAGILPPFGSIGVGCGVNWDTENEGYVKRLTTLFAPPSLPRNIPLPSCKSPFYTLFKSHFPTKVPPNYTLDVMVLRDSHSLRY